MSVFVAAAPDAKPNAWQTFRKKAASAAHTLKNAGCPLVISAMLDKMITLADNAEQKLTKDAFDEAARDHMRGLGVGCTDREEEIIKHINANLVQDGAITRQALRDFANELKKKGFLKVIRPGSSSSSESGSESESES